MIYLDAAATAKYRSVDDIIVDTMVTAMKDSWMNPSSLYASNVKKKIELCRANVAEFIGAKPEEIYYTSGASESNNMAIRGWVDWAKEHIIQKEEEADKNGDNSEAIHYSLMSPTVMCTTIEHKSILDLMQSDSIHAMKHTLFVDNNGLIDFGWLEDKLKCCEFDKCPVLVSVCMANNEIGTVQDIHRISKMVHKYNGVLHVDATQALPYIPINVEELGIDMMSCSGHKLSSALRGIGFLYKKNSINIHPLIYGAQEKGLRGGTENTYGIIGLNKALEYCDMSPEKYEDMCNKRNYFIERLVSKFGCKLNGHDIFRLPNNVNVTFPQNITGESLLYMLDMSNIKCSVGSACNSREVEPSHVLKAIGLTNDEAMRTVRFTLPEDITYDEISHVIDEIGKAIKILETI